MSVRFTVTLARTGGALLWELSQPVLRYDHGSTGILDANWSRWGGRDRYARGPDQWRSLALGQPRDHLLAWSRALLRRLRGRMRLSPSIHNGSWASMKVTVLRAVQRGPHDRAVRAAHLAILVVAMSCALACGGGDPLVLEFGPITATAEGITPGCEQQTPRAEFSSIWSVSADGEDRELGRLTSVSFSEQESKTVTSSVTIGASTGCEVCVSSKGTQEIDELFDDTLSEDEDCHTVQADTGQHEFELKMELEACVLRVKFPMVVKPL